MEIRHEPSWYDKEQFTSLTFTQLVCFDEVHTQQVSGSSVARNMKKHNILFPRDKEANIDVKNGKYDMNNQPKKSTFKHEQEGKFNLGVAKIKSKNGTITCKRCPVFDYSGGKIVNIDAYK